MRKDTVWKAYLSDDGRFADLVNGILFHGKQIVKDGDVGELDTQTGYTQRPGEAGKRSIKIRDTVRKVRIGKGDVHIGIECGECVDYSMPLRDMNYNVCDYEKQAAEIRRRVRREIQGLHGGERMYQFRKDSRVSPSVSVLLYCGKDDWDGPETLHGMIDFADMPGEVKMWAQDYRMHILEVRKLEDTGVFHTDVRQVLDFIRHSADKKALKELVTGDPYYQNMEEDAWNVIVKYANVGKLIDVKDYYREDGTIDMCTALIELLQDERKEGFEEGERIGERRGERRTQDRLVRNLMDSMDLTEEQAAAALKINKDRKAKRAKSLRDRRNGRRSESW